MKTTRRFILGTVLLSAAAARVAASSYYWVGTGGGQWNNTSMWASSSGGTGGAYGVPPGAGDDVIFDASSGTGTAVIETGYSIKSLNASAYAGKITFLASVAGNLTVANDFNLGGSATLICPYSSNAGEGTGRSITVGNLATVNGTIHANGQGFPGATPPATGTGPGGIAANYTGGTHGGRGGCRSNGSNVESAPEYGSVLNPVSLGSGGARVGADGGGAIRLTVTGELTVGGSITANGLTGTSSYSGGAGGSVWLTAGTLAGGGTIAANGGAASTTANSGGGGGGRVSLQYGGTPFGGSVSVAGGTGRWANQEGQPGSLWEPQRFDGLHGSLASPANVTISTSYRYHFPDAVTNYWTLTLASGVTFEPSDGSLYIAEFKPSHGTLRYNDFAHNRAGLPMKYIRIPSNTVVLSGLSSTQPFNLYLPGHTYTFDSLTIESHATLHALGNTTNVNASSGGTALKPHGSGVELICNTAVISGTINASGRGFRGWQPPEGPGGGGTYDGGSHGGKGGNNDDAPPYGRLSRPSALGSGGSRSSADAGSAVTIRAPGGLTLNGTITAAGWGSIYGGGSGGSVWLVAGTISGNGTINVDGGFGDTSGGGGGAGRVALEYAASTFGENISLAGGTGKAADQPGSNGKPGTLFRSQAPEAALAPGAAGVRIQTDFAVNAYTNGIKVVRSVTTSKPSKVIWTDTCKDRDGAWLNNVATHTVSGLNPSAKYQLLDNDVAVATLTASGAGILTFDISLTGGMAHTTTLQQSASGSVIVIR